jgi:hypothetical protein
MNLFKIIILLIAFVLGWSTMEEIHLNKKAKLCNNNGGVMMKQYGADWECINLIKD